MKEQKPTRIFVDGSGANASGKGSGFAYWVEGEPKGHAEFRDGLTNNQAEYHAILAALKNVRLKSRVEILSDSELAVNQLAGRYAIRDPDLSQLAAEIGIVLKQRKLTAGFIWIPRGQNRADKLLSRESGGEVRADVQRHQR